jgi:micrococcal nuclease
MPRNVRNPFNPGLMLVVLFVAISWWFANQPNDHLPPAERPAPSRKSDSRAPSPPTPTTATRPDPCDPKIVDEFTGRVQHVQDGDSFRLQTPNAPGKDQPYGDSARQNLKRLIEGREVAIKSVGEDQYDRTLGYVVLDGVEINEQLVRDGWAWHYSKDSCEQRFAEAEDAARTARRGLWERERPQPPWEFRRQKNSGR